MEERKGSIERGRGFKAAWGIGARESPKAKKPPLTPRKRARAAARRGREVAKGSRAGG